MLISYRRMFADSSRGRRYGDTKVFPIATSYTTADERTGKEILEKFDKFGIPYLP